MVAKLLALSSRDMFTAFACTHHYFTSLESLTQPNGFGKKTVPGKSVPTLWASGAPAPRDAVLRMCENDARMIAALHRAAHADGTLRRQLRRGAITTWEVPTADDGTRVPPAWLAFERYETEPLTITIPSPCDPKKGFQWADVDKYQWRSSD